MLATQTHSASVSGLGESPDRWSISDSNSVVSPRPGAVQAATVDSLAGSRRSQSGWEKERCTRREGVVARLSIPRLPVDEARNGGTVAAWDQRGKRLEGFR